MIDPNYKLDKLLEFFAEPDIVKTDRVQNKYLSRYSSSWNYAVWLMNKELEARPFLTYFSQQIDKLHNDGYLSLQEGENFLPSNGAHPRKDIMCRITFEGLTFNENGGYRYANRLRLDKNSRLENLENHQKAHGSYMTWLTLTLAAFALLSLFLQCLDKFDRVFRLDIWLALILLLTGTILGTIATILLSGVWRKQSDMRSRLP